jgi:hypothetical protein
MQSFSNDANKNIPIRIAQNLVDLTPHLLKDLEAFHTRFKAGQYCISFHVRTSSGANKRQESAELIPACHNVVWCFVQSCWASYDAAKMSMKGPL